MGTTTLDPPSRTKYRKNGQQPKGTGGKTAAKIAKELWGDDAATLDVNAKLLVQVHGTFRHWLGDQYDLDTVNAVLAAAATEKLGGDPLWLLLIGGPGSGKTEAVQTLDGIGAHVISTIASEGALLSASPKKSRSKDATGGLLKKIGEHGILVVKDFTSILSASRELRGSVLAAIREIYDGRYVRNVGTDGGHTLTWIGRLVLIGACTTAWDAAHAVVATMGDRFVLKRLDSKTPEVRAAASRQAIKNTGNEVAMRQQLAAVVGDLLGNIESDIKIADLSDEEDDRINKAAEIVTMARTAVERSYNGDIIDVHDPEMPTRFTRQLTQVVRGGVAIGLQRDAAMALAITCAKDSIPPLRLLILLDVAAHPLTNPSEVRKRLGKPWTTIKREMEALTMIGILTCDEEEGEEDDKGKPTRKWFYDLAKGFDRNTLLIMNGLEPAKHEPVRHKIVVTPVKPVTTPPIQPEQREEEQDFIPPQVGIPARKAVLWVNPASRKTVVYPLEWGRPEEFGFGDGWNDPIGAAYSTWLELDDRQRVELMLVTARDLALQGYRLEHVLETLCVVPEFRAVVPDPAVSIEQLREKLQSKPPTFRVIGDYKDSDNAMCAQCRKFGNVKKIKDASKPGSKTEPLHEACAAAWFDPETRRKARQY